MTGQDSKRVAAALDRDAAIAVARRHLETTANLMLCLSRQDVNPILEVARLLAQAFRAGNKVLLCGNGGSAADCQHMAAEFVNRLSAARDRPGLPAIALTTDTSFLTAHANDAGYEGVFERQVRALGKPGDVLIGITTSGSSPNVLRALAAAGEMGMVRVALSGAGGKAGSLVDRAIEIPSRETQAVQEALLSVEHIVCELVERALFGSQD